jgi:uridine kinase
MARPVILVDGIDGSGKSHLAERIRAEAAAAGLEPVLLRVDDFRVATDWTRVTDEAAVYYARYYDLARLDACVRAYLDGEPSLEVPAFDPVSERPTDAEVVPLEDAKLLIVEGVFGRRITNTREATIIYIETSYAEAKRRIIERDVAKGRTRADVEGRVDRRYAPSQRRYRDELQPRDHAHVLVDHEILGKPTVISAAIEGRDPAIKAALAFMADGLHGPRI